MFTAGIISPPLTACLDAVLLAVSAVVPLMLVATFSNWVCPDSAHRCRVPFLDCMMRKCGDANTTIPRCTSSVLPCWLGWLKVCWCTLASWAMLVPIEEPQPLTAEFSRPHSLVMPNRELYEADCAVTEAGPWLATTAATAPPPRASAAAAMPTRVFTFDRPFRRGRPI